MKTLKGFALSLILALALISCKDDDTDSCSDSINRISVAATAYSNDPSSTAACEEYKAAMQAYIDNSSCPGDASQYQATIDALTCD